MLLNVFILALSLVTMSDFGMAAVKEVFGLPVLAGARFVGIEEGVAQIQVDHLIRDFPDNPEDFKSNVKAKRVISRQLLAVNIEDGKVLMGGPREITNSQAVFKHSSPSFTWSVTALMRPGEPKSKPTFQVYKQDKFVGEFDMGSVHGDFCTDVHFGWTGWDEEAGYFIYQAEWKEAEDKVKDYRWNPSWGETVPNVRKPGIFVVSLGESAKVIAKLEPNDQFQPSQLIRTTKDSIHFIGIEVIPGRKYGVAYCPNRPTALYSWNYIDGSNATKVEIANAKKEYEAINYPVYNEKKNMIFFFGTYIGGSHFHAQSLYSYNMENNFVEQVVDGEADLIRSGKSSFINGLFPDEPNVVTILPSDGSIFIPSYNKSSIPLVRIYPYGKISIGGPGLAEEESWQLLQIFGDLLLASVSSRASLPKLMLGLVKPNKVKWYELTSHSHSLDIKQTIHRVTDTIEIVLSTPGTIPSTTPLIIYPHGGPNYAYSIEWSPFCALAAKLGYAVASINYTGSAGYSQKNIRALEGKIGELDVEDCLIATRHLVENLGYDRSKLFLFGGSHGGFLVAHLSARTEFDWRAVVVHNGVIDLPSILVTSDIPEFAFGQLGIEYDLRHPRPPTSSELDLMKAASPSSRVSTVKAPTLVVIGEEDLRVPPSQGKSWYGWLKGQGVETEIICFPETGHSIDSAEGQYQEHSAIFHWFAKH